MRESERIDVQSIEDFFQPISPSKRFLANDSGTIETRSADQKSFDIAATKAHLVLKWNLPAFPPVCNQRPTFDEKWLRGLYKMAGAVASGKMDDPHISSKYFDPTCPKLLRVEGMNDQSV